MAGYIRQDTTGAISNNSIIEADDLNSEFDAVQGAFNAITGHNHDGTSAEGAPIEVVGPAQDVVITASTIRPKTDNAVDLGTSTLEFKDLHLDGTANIDNLVADAGTVAGVAITTLSNTQTLTNKTLTSPVINTADINTPDINGGTIDGTVIGGSTPAAISGTTGSFTTTLDVTGVGSADTLRLGSRSVISVPDRGGVARTPSLMISGSSFASTSPSVAFYNTTNTAGLFNFLRSNTATVGNHAISSNGQTIGTLQWAASDGTDFIRAAQIEAVVDGTPSTNNMPARLVFTTTPSGSSVPAEAMRITSTGNVGIGTSSPTEALTVQGNILSNSSVLASGLIAVGDATAPHFSFSSDTDTGMFRATTDNLGFSTSGVERIRIAATGNVGIGTSSPAAKLQVTGDMITSEDATIHGATVGRGGGGITTNTALGSGALSSNTTGNNNTAVGHLAMRDITTGSQNVAIGQGALRNSTTGVSNTAIGFSSAINATSDNNTAVGRFALRNLTTGSGNIALGTGAGDADLGDNNTIIGRIAGTAGLAGTVIIGAGTAERMRIDSAGNVGIGTSAPTHLFTVGEDNSGNPGKISLGRGGTEDANIFFTRVGVNDAEITYDADEDLFIKNNFAAGDVVYSNNLGAHIFKTGSVGVAEAMRITSAGNVGIGTTTDPLGVTTDASGHFIRGGGLASFSGNSNIAIGVNRTGTDGAVMQFRKAGTIVGNIAVTATTTSYNITSDYRLKEDVQPLVGASDRVLSLKPCNFAWKADGTRTDGFIAHEAQAVVPEAVTGDKDGDEMQVMDQSKLVPLLTAALQEALKEIADLKGRITALEA